MSKEFENYIRRLVRPPASHARSSPVGRRATPASGQGAGEPQSAVGSSPEVIANNFASDPMNNFVDRGTGQVNTNVIGWRLAQQPGRELGLNRFAQTGMRSDLNPKGQPEMRYNIVTYG